MIVVHAGDHIFRDLFLVSIPFHFLAFIELRCVHRLFSLGELCGVALILKRRIKELLFQGAVHRQLMKNLLRELLFLPTFFFQELIEERFDLTVIVFQHLYRIGGSLLLGWRFRFGFD